MIKAPALRKTFGLFAALLQLVVLGASVAHESRASVAGSSHVEGQAGDTCTPPEASDCAICRVLSTGGYVPASQGAGAFEARSFDVPRERGVAWLDATSRRQPPSRAPPSI